jgi:TPR repeat protein
VRPDPARAAALYELGCEAGLAQGCLSAASLYAWDRSIGGDWPRVARLNRRACDLGDAQGCAAVWDARAATVVR